ncbi:hypothetical protein [Enterococcus sp. HY326]|uniref:hypothetical protein n=1 Tax=Enterococcus sp. HY326 TaxID=2971265 RepID=UPI00223E9F5A|nr:hypothetical protein [Enterococcus sp. HY326]
MKNDLVVAMAKFDLFGKDSSTIVLMGIFLVLLFFVIKFAVREGINSSQLVKKNQEKD